MNRQSTVFLNNLFQYFSLALLDEFFLYISWEFPLLQLVFDDSRFITLHFQELHSGTEVESF